MVNGQWTYKGVTIWMDGTDGKFRFRDKAGKVQAKNSLEVAQKAIDREAGTPIVLAMSGYGERLEIAKRTERRTSRTYSGKIDEYFDPKGRQVRPFSGLLTWNEEIAAKLADVRRRDLEEYERHHEAEQALREERQALEKQAGYFSYDAAVGAANQEGVNDGNSN